MIKKIILCLLVLASHSTYPMHVQKPLVGFIGVVAATAGAAHHWYQQLKPFKNDVERHEALKDIILNESTFTHHWDKEKYEKIKKNPALLEIIRTSSDFAVTEQDDKIFLMINNQFTPSYDSNRLELKNMLQSIALIVGHEGAHIAQGIKNIWHVGGYALGENFFLLQFFTKDLPKINFDKDSLLSEPVPGTGFLIRPRPITETEFMHDKHFQSLAHEFHVTVQEYDKCYQRYVTANRLLESSKNEYLQNLRRMHLAKTQSAALNKMHALTQASNRVTQYIEANADIQAVGAILNTDMITTKEKLRALSQQQNFLREKGESTERHPQLSIRLQILEMGKEYLMPLVAFESGAENMSRFWDPSL